MRTLALFGLLLAACSSGGGGTKWSADVTTTHPWMPGQWSGDALSTQSPGAHAGVTLTIGAAGDDKSFFPVSGSFSGQCASPDAGRVHAVNLQVEIVGSVVRIDGTIIPSTPARIEGTYTVLSGPCAGDRGNVTLTYQFAPPSPATIGMTIEDIDTPQLFVRIVTTDVVR